MTTLLPADLVRLDDSKPVTDSLRVTQHFGKSHRHVLRAIDNLERSEKYRLLNFGQTVTHRASPSCGASILARTSP